MNQWSSSLLLGAQPDAWTNTFFGLAPDERFVLLIVGIGCATGVICTVVVFLSMTLNTVHRRRTEVALKRELVERGMSADEITQIIESASPPDDATDRWIASWGKDKKP